MPRLCTTVWVCFWVGWTGLLLGGCGQVSSDNMTAVGDNEKIATVSGGQVSGIVTEGVAAYKGIPYAASPVGELRWKPPQAVVAWDGVRNGEGVGSACPQLPRTGDSPFPEATEPKSEDCLFLNVWTPAVTDTQLPVMVWYHGGSWSRGSGVAFTPDATQLAKKGAVVVTVNYRLGVLGFLAHPELTEESPHRSSGNYGFLDQIAALEWVQENIATFGGDPRRVTIFGESAGAWTVSILMASPLAKDLFHRGIAESGGRFQPQVHLAEARNGLPSAEDSGVAFAVAAGADSLQDLRLMSFEEVLAVPGYNRPKETVDGFVLPSEVRTAFAEGNYNDVPLIVGSNANESALAGPPGQPENLEEYREVVESQYGDLIEEFDAAYPVVTEADIPKAFSISGHRSFNLPMRQLARATAARGRSQTYMYYFSHIPPHPRSSDFGAMHTFEIPYVFNHLAQPDWLYQPYDFELADSMSSYWVNLASTGDPNGDGLPEWPPFDLSTEPYLEFGDTVATGRRLLKRELDFVEQFDQLQAMPGGER